MVKAAEKARNQVTLVGGMFWGTFWRDGMFSGFALDLPQIELCSSGYVPLNLYMRHDFPVLQELYSGLGAWNDTAASAQETEIFGKEYLPECTSKFIDSYLSRD